MDLNESSIMQVCQCCGQVFCVCLYISICGEVNISLCDFPVSRSLFVHNIVVGDFNCIYGSGFYDEFASFADDNNFVQADYKRLNDIVTYARDNGIRSSWIDHVFCSYCLDAIISQLTVVNDVIILIYF